MGLANDLVGTPGLAFLLNAVADLDGGRALSSSAVLVRVNEN